MEVNSSDAKSLVERYVAADILRYASGHEFDPDGCVVPMQRTRSTRWVQTLGTNRLRARALTLRLFFWTLTRDNFKEMYVRRRPEYVHFIPPGFMVISSCRDMQCHNPHHLMLVPCPGSRGLIIPYDYFPHLRKDKPICPDAYDFTIAELLDTMFKIPPDPKKRAMALGSLLMRPLGQPILVDAKAHRYESPRNLIIIPEPDYSSVDILKRTWRPSPDFAGSMDGIRNPTVIPREKKLLSTKIRYGTSSVTLPHIFWSLCFGNKPCYDVYVGGQATRSRTTDGEFSTKSYRNENNSAFNFNPLSYYMREADAPGGAKRFIYPETYAAWLENHGFRVLPPPSCRDDVLEICDEARKIKEKLVTYVRGAKKPRSNFYSNVPQPYAPGTFKEPEPQNGPEPGPAPEVLVSVDSLSSGSDDNPVCQSCWQPDRNLSLHEGVPMCSSCIEALKEI